MSQPMPTLYDSEILVRLTIIASSDVEEAPWQAVFVAEAFVNRIELAVVEWIVFEGITVTVDPVNYFFADFHLEENKKCLSK